jgi:hypothetical protein
MKYTYIIALFAVMLMSMTMSAQSNSIDKYFEQYQDDERFTRVSISSRMFGLFSNFDREDEAEQEVVETISKLKGLKILAADSISDAKTIYRAAIKKPSVDMEELMTVENANQEMRFFISEADGIITELLMISYDDDSVMLMSLVGDIDLKQISKLSNKMNIEGFEHLENVGQ